LASGVLTLYAKQITVVAIVAVKVVIHVITYMDYGVKT